MATVAFITLGCKVNQTETEAMAGLFERRGYTTGDPGHKADVYVVNTCSVTHLGERKSRQMIRRAARMNPDAVIAVTGCFAQVAPEEAAAIEGVDVVIGTRDRDRIVDFVEKARQEKAQVIAVQDIMQVREFEEIPLQGSQGRTRAFLKIQDGCDNYCSYCIIPYARGHLRSLSLPGLRREVSRLAEAGFREIVLTGINLGAYGREVSKLTLEDAVRTVLADSRIDRVRLSSTESLEISGGLVGLMAGEPRFCPHLHLPLQAGEDSVLASMRRPYTTGDYARLLENLRDRVADVAVTTDIIAGFPGETEEMFLRTLDFVERMQFAKIHVFPYSRRKGTPAAALKGQVPDAEKRRRVAELLQVGERSGAQFRQRFIGRTMAVLVEKAEAGTAEGLTPNYQRVQIRTENVPVRENELWDVELEGLTAEGFTGRLKK